MKPISIKQQLLGAVDWQACDGGIVVISCSGGLDSVVLAHALTDLLRSGFSADCWSESVPRILLWHLRHGMRPDDHLDAELVTRLAESLDVKVIVDSADVPAERQPGKDSLESAARRIRYRRLAALLDNLPGSVACTAHHAADNSETILFNLLRGTGPDGLRGISPVLDGRIHRPLLHCGKQQIREYAFEHELEYREDPSNAGLQFSRNRIRQNVIPELERINPAAIRHINRLPGLLSEMSRQASAQLQHFPAHRIEMQLPLLASPGLPFGLVEWQAHAGETNYRAQLKQFLLSQGFPINHHILQMLNELLNLQRESLVIANWKFILLSSSSLFYASSDTAPGSQASGATTLSVPPLQLQPAERLSLIEVLRTGKRIADFNDWLRELVRREGGPSTCWSCLLPATAAAGYHFRLPREADRIRLPNGDRRKVGDVFTDHRIPLFLRRCWALLADAADEPVWIPAICDSQLMHTEDSCHTYEIHTIRQLQ